MNTTSIPMLEAPRFESLEPMLFAGLVERYDGQSSAGIPDQWQRFTPYLGNISEQVGKVAYGICYNFDQDGNFDYMCGVEVKGIIDLPKEFKSLSVPAQKYVVFRHKEHISSLRATITAIWEQWFPTFGYQAAAAPTLERYGPEFNGVTGTGGLEIWIPIES